MPNNLKRMRIVIIGSSDIVKDHINAFKRIKFKITAIASSRLNSKNSKIIAKKYNIKKIYNHWKQMLQNELFDGILIASKIEATYSIMKYALIFNKPILVEKPVSMRSDIIKKLIKNNNKLVMVGYNRRCYESVVYLKNFIKKTKEKLIINITIPERSEIKFFYSNSVHIIDIIHFIFGKLKMIKNIKILKKNKIGGFISLLTSKKGHVINIIGNWNSADNFSINLYIKNMKLTLCPLEILTIYKGIKIKEPTELIPIRRYMPKILKIISTAKHNKKIKPGFHQQALDFHYLIKNNKLKNNSAKLIDSLNNIQLCEKIAGKYKN